MNEWSLQEPDIRLHGETAFASYENKGFVQDPAGKRTAVTGSNPPFFASRMDAGSSASFTAAARSSQTATNFRWKALKRLVFLAPPEPRSPP